MKRQIKSLLSVTTALMIGSLIYTGVANADPIGGPSNLNCTDNSCQGATYTLTYSGSPLPDADPTHETFRVTLTIDTSTYTGGGGFIDTVAVKVVNSLTGGSVFSAPTGTGNWSALAINTGLNANGCSGGGGGFGCTEYTGVGAGVAVGGTLAWTFDLTMTNGSLFTDPFEASIKARYVDSDDEKVGALVSEKITLQRSTVPEPASVLLLGSGLVGIGLWGMNRRKNA